MILDTHRFVEELIDAGFNKNQAEVFVNRLNQSSDNLATKGDIVRLENKLDASIEKLETKMESKITEAKYDIIKFIVPFLFAILLSVVGLWFK